MYVQIKQIISYSIKSGLHKLVRQSGTYDLLGVDIMLDHIFKPYLIEFNMSPALVCDTKTQQEIIPHVVKKSIDITLKIYNSGKGAPEMIKKQLIDIDSFEFLFSEFTLDKEILNDVVKNPLTPAKANAKLGTPSRNILNSIKANNKNPQ